MNENFSNFAPLPSPDSDSGADMGENKRQNRRSGHFSQPACSVPRMAQLLLRYDQLDSVARAGVMRHAKACPQCGPRARLFQAADRWLGSAAAQASDGSECPEADELYDFGRGPGFNALSAVRNAEIELHLTGCESCRGFTATLESPIPIPYATGFDEFVPETETPSDQLQSAPINSPRLTGPRLSRIERLPMWMPLAVAAGLIVMIQLITDDAQTGTQTSVAQADSSKLANGESASTDNLFPTMAVLRGEGDAPLLYPRGKVLTSATSLLGLGSLTCELAPVENAELYRVRVLRHSGGAFDAGSLIESSESTEAVIDLSDLELAPGHYTWTASAIVRGLERPLGERDFDVVDDLELNEQWSALEALPESERGARRVTLLHELGYFGAARSLARSLPQSNERDAYLAAWPGR